jgi:hypothetical protein
MIFDLIIFGAGLYCGHVLSPWIDGKMADLQKRNGDDDEWTHR